jgi:hypothetical protein
MKEQARPRQSVAGAMRHPLMAEAFVSGRRGRVSVAARPWSVGSSVEASVDARRSSDSRVVSARRPESRDLLIAQERDDELGPGAHAMTQVTTSGPRGLTNAHRVVT